MHLTLFDFPSDAPGDSFLPAFHSIMKLDHERLVFSRCQGFGITDDLTAIDGISKGCSPYMLNPFTVYIIYICSTIRLNTLNTLHFKVCNQS